MTSLFLNPILSHKCVARMASTGTHVTSDLLNTSRFHMELYIPGRDLTSRFLSTTTSKGHMETTYCIWPHQRTNIGTYRGQKRTKRGLTISSQSCSWSYSILQSHSHILHPPESPQVPQPPPIWISSTSQQQYSTPQRHWTSLPVHKRHLNIFTSAHT